MLTRSMFRHTCFRMKNGQPVSKGNEKLVPIVEKQLSKGQSWDNFSTEWDIYLDKEYKLHIVKPESDYEYAHSVCIEAGIYTKSGKEFDFDSRAMNVISIVELNMMDNMKWEDYNRTWSIYLDSELKQLKTKHFKTNQNIVTPEMIEASKLSDGALMANPAEIPNVVLDKFETIDESNLTEAEKNIINSFKKKKTVGK